MAAHNALLEHWSGYKSRDLVVDASWRSGGGGTGHSACGYRNGRPTLMITFDLIDQSGLPSVLEFVCLPWSEVCSARVTSLLLLFIITFRWASQLLYAM